MVKSSLCLDDVLDDSPQTRCLLKLFETDTVKLQTYTGRVRGAMARVVGAQAQLTSALQEVSTVLGEYNEQDFPLDYGHNQFPAVVHKFHSIVAELGSWMDVVGQQLQNCVLYPVEKFCKELEEASNRKELYHALADEMHKAVDKYAKLHRKEQARKVEEVGEEVCCARRRFHQNGVRYYIQLNNLQFTRRIFLLEPVLSLLYAYRALFHSGHNALAQHSDLSDFFTSTQEQVQSLHSEQQTTENETKQFVSTISEVERLQPALYYLEGAGPPIDTSSTRKEGYLFMKTKGTLSTRWDELYFFTQGGSLMCRGKDELAGGVLLELTGDAAAVRVDNEDRRNTFALTNSTIKRQLVLQALSERDRDQWIQVINNVARDGRSQPDPPLPVVFTAPIQFDLLSPAEEDRNVVHSDPPLGEYPVRFLGCVEVASDRGERVTQDATRQILAARLTHNIVMATQARMVLAQDKLLLMDQDTPKAAFNLDDLSYWSAYTDNERLFSIIVRTKGGGVDGRHKFNCYVMESVGGREAKEICDGLGAATTAAFQDMFKKKATTHS